MCKAKKELEKLRDQLNKKAESLEYDDQEILKLSKKIDQKILDYINQSNKN